MIGQIANTSFGSNDRHGSQSWGLGRTRWTGRRYQANGTHVVCLVMPRSDASGLDASGAQSPAPPELLVRADALMSRYPGCFLFWRTDARIRSLDDVRLVVRQLREYGDREAWLAARDLARCLLQRSRRTS